MKCLGLSGNNSWNSREGFIILLDLFRKSIFIIVLIKEGWIHINLSIKPKVIKEQKFGTTNRQVEFIN